MRADASPADSLLAIDFEEFERGATVRSPEWPGYFPDTGCVLDVSDTKILPPRYSAGAAGGDVLSARIVGLTDRCFKERLLAIV